MSKTLGVHCYVTLLSAAETYGASPYAVMVTQVMASGLNRGELVRVGEAKSGGPILAGIEFAGIVSQVGPDVRGLLEGDRVIGHGWGGQSEYVLAEAGALIPIPATLSWVEAAAFPNVFISSHDALVTNGEFRAGQSVLVNAAKAIGQVQVTVATLTGQQVMSQAYTANGDNQFTTNIDLSTQAKGIYFVEVRADGEKVVSKLVVR